MPKFRYALTATEQILDVFTLERQQLDKSERFFSIDTGQEIIPRLGNLRTKHFAHKPGTEYKGSLETYLHSLAKHVLYNDYLMCLNNNKPFLFEYKEKLRCIKNRENFHIECDYNTKTKTFDLTQYFSEILLEKKDADFIPDVMIINPETKERIYFEVAVTHFSSEQKINSNTRIIEFVINDESDIDKIQLFKANNSAIDFRTYNFRTRTNMF